MFEIDNNPTVVTGEYEIPVLGRFLMIRWRSPDSPHAIYGTTVKYLKNRFFPHLTYEMCVNIFADSIGSQLIASRLGYVVPINTGSLQTGLSKYYSRTGDESVLILSQGVDELLHAASSTITKSDYRLDNGPTLPNRLPNTAGTERYIQMNYWRTLGGKLEVKTPHGRIDLLTSHTIYEFKNHRGYKSAIGQLITYSETYPNKRLVMVLFDMIYPSTQKRRDRLNSITELCLSRNIRPNYIFK